MNAKKTQYMAVGKTHFNNPTPEPVAEPGFYSVGVHSKLRDSNMRLEHRGTTEAGIQGRQPPVGSMGRAPLGAQGAKQFLAFLGTFKSK